ncbi:adenylate/guanylate cyclase domain-containing protein [Bradyrhizobium sp. Arg237L]|uniref:adenylate/guanylate cyclase domain-containing protein n=1 Tax=Bradyrhizobium sp. Arg237L TaxID=3003352 RepID=UPI00249DC80E|nr:adenylate/guanylate cyclase domain-containing protein [Bradyrhizobium sp. Arg237L]MDI4239407.1 adenylate/guanylate cyclase domain-containing protein [Bradyrhizobium sp. Arg237L]
MFRPSMTRYAMAGELSIAYQTVGEGPIDLIFVPGMVTQLEYLHEFPSYDEFLEGLSHFARVVTFDKSGQGLSDRSFGAPSLEQRMDDIRAIMDDIGTKRCVLLGGSEGCPIASLFAATFPTKVSHLILFGGFARFTAVDGYPYMRSEDDMIGRMETMAKHWGTGELAIRGWLPSSLCNPDAVQRFATLERLTCSPGALRTMYRQNMMIDVRPVLPGVKVPTLVLHRARDALVPLENGQYLARNIPDARLIVYEDAIDHLIFAGDIGQIVNDIQSFVTGSIADASIGTRVLATVLFTDIVRSTSRAAEIGDTAWRSLLSEHDDCCRKTVTRHRGFLVKTTGDGILATFDGPGRAIKATLEVRERMASFGIPIRAGLHTGEIELLPGDVAGIAVHAAARVMSQAEAGEVLVSRVVKDLVAGGGFDLVEKGRFDLKGLPEAWDLYAVAIRKNL